MSVQGGSELQLVAGGEIEGGCAAQAESSSILLAKGGEQEGRLCLQGGNYLQWSYGGEWEGGFTVQGGHGLQYGTGGEREGGTGFIAHYMDGGEVEGGTWRTIQSVVGGEIEGGYCDQYSESPPPPPPPTTYCDMCPVTWVYWNLTMTGGTGDFAYLNVTIPLEQVSEGLCYWFTAEDTTFFSLTFNASTTLTRLQIERSSGGPTLNIIYERTWVSDDCLEPFDVPFNSFSGSALGTLPEVFLEPLP